MSGRVEGKIALVTGGTQGIGKATARVLLEEGGKVVITGRKEETGQAAEEELHEGGYEVSYLAQDVAEEADWKRVIEQVIQRYGRLDILLNNAGVAGAKTVEDTSLNDWRHVMRINLDGVFLGTRYGILAMKKSGGGSIINNSSIEGFIGDRRLAAYNASKGGVLAFSRSATLHCARVGLGIRVNTVHPGYIWTRMVEVFVNSQDDPEAAKKELEQLHPIGHLGEPEDIAYGVLFLASDEAKFLTGSALVIDGGYTAR